VEVLSRFPSPWPTPSTFQARLRACFASLLPLPLSPLPFTSQDLVYESLSLDIDLINFVPRVANVRVPMRRLGLIVSATAERSKLDVLHLVVPLAALLPTKSARKLVPLRPGLIPLRRFPCARLRIEVFVRAGRTTLALLMCANGTVAEPCERSEVSSKADGKAREKNSARRAGRVPQTCEESVEEEVSIVSASMARRRKKGKRTRFWIAA
jgi:hypothetical protein